MSTAGADRRILLWLCGGVLLLIVLTALFAPATSDDDPVPSTYNSGTHGAKAAFLLLSDLGYTVSRSEVRTVDALEAADAPHTTYILAAPEAPAADAEKREYQAIQRFLERGGRVLATGFRGAYFLPGGRTGEPTRTMSALCETAPEGRSAYAAAGSVALYDVSTWNAAEPLVRVDQRCGADAVAIHQSFPHGGEMMWWSSAEPLTTRGLAQDNSLRLLLAAAGPASGRRVLFDEFYHGVQTSPSDYLRGLPLRSLTAQAGLVVALLLFSFSRRSGPIREPMAVPRTSPVEFAQNMGALYQRAGATQPVTEAARRRMLHVLGTACGLPRETLQGSSVGIAAAVHTRFGLNPQPLEDVLGKLEQARYERLRPREALKLVRSANAEMLRLIRVTRSSSDVVETQAESSLEMESIR